MSAGTSGTPDTPVPSDDELLATLGQHLVENRSPRDAQVTDFRALVADHRPRARPVSRLSTRTRRPVLLAAAAAVLAVFAGIGVLLTTDDDEPGTVEYAGPVTTPDGRDVGTLEVVMQDIGRTIDLETDALEILPTGEFYEVWFVGPGDSVESPNRISAGTFHPDPDGRSFVDFTAAVDPAMYPTVSVTAEPGDGDPRPSATEVLRIDLGTAG